MSGVVRGVDVLATELRSSLEPVLYQTLNLFSLYRKRQGDDAAHWYNERATLSVIAAAAWKAGGVALEEYSISKRGKAGRADLWIKMPGETFSFEAKQTWPTIAPGAAKKRVTEWLSKAARDASRIPRNEAPQRAGLVFVVPDLPLSRMAKFDPKAFVQEVATVPHDFKAWWFAGKPWPTNRHMRVYPGIVIMGRVIGSRGASLEVA